LWKRRRGRLRWVTARILARRERQLVENNPFRG
jgi:hypothetical protein